MDYVVLDTDVASLIFRKRLPAAMAARLANKTWCLTFVTIGEMTQWAALRDWSRRNLASLEAWMADCVSINASWEVAQSWGRLSAAGKRRGQTHPINDTWIASCCLTEGLPLATVNVKDYEGFVEHYGLTLVTPDQRRP
jgi:predicted nucleic acid-binding protein